MAHWLIGTISIAFLLAVICLRVHIGLALYLTGLLGYWLLAGNFLGAISILSTQPYFVTASFTMAVVPLFMLMGIFAGQAGLAEDAYSIARIWAGTIRGGLAIATIIANALFGTVCGSSVAACAVFTKFSLPEMVSQGYKAEFACAAIAAAGTLAMLIPPSVLMVVYGVLTGVSIGKLFIAGIGPGLLLTVLYSLGVALMVRINPSLAPATPTRFTWQERVFSLRKVWGIAVLAILILGGIYGGFFTPQEAGAIGAFGTFIIVIIMRKFRWRGLFDTLSEVARTNAIIFFIFSGAILYGRFLAFSSLPVLLSRMIAEANVPPMVVLIATMAFYLLLGCLLDSNSMLFITMPIIFPISQSLGWDPIWFGILVIVNMEVGLLTPPVGLNVFVIKAVAGPLVTLEALFRSVVPFFLIMLAGLALLVIFPSISTWLPGLMK